MKNRRAATPPAVCGGSRLTLRCEHRDDAKPVQVTVDRFANGQIWVKGSSGAMEEGDSLVLEYKIDDDGRYRADGEVESRSPDCTVITCGGEWRRVQDRSFVRISTHGLEVKVPPRPGTSRRGNANPHNQDARFEMLDVSAGGIRFESRERFDVDDVFVCHFELPGQSCYVLPARIVRSQKKPGYMSLYQVAVEFVDLNEDHRAQLLRWIYHEQARRHRAAKKSR